MDNQRLFLYAGLMFLGLLIWQQWQLDYNMPPPPTAQDAEQSVPNPELPEAPPADVPVDDGSWNHADPNNPYSPPGGGGPGPACEPPGLLAHPLPRPPGEEAPQDRGLHRFC